MKITEGHLFTNEEYEPLRHLLRELVYNKHLYNLYTEQIKVVEDFLGEKKMINMDANIRLDGFGFTTTKQGNPEEVTFKLTGPEIDELRRMINYYEANMGSESDALEFNVNLEDGYLNVKPDFE